MHELSNYKVLNISIFFNEISMVLFIYFRSHRVACGTLIPRSGLTSVPPVLGVQSLNPWTTKEVPLIQLRLSNWEVGVCIAEVKTLRLRCNLTRLGLQAQLPSHCSGSQPLPSGPTPAACPSCPCAPHLPSTHKSWWLGSHHPAPNSPNRPQQLLSIPALGFMHQDSASSFTSPK